ncbi:MAG: N-acetylneuraminate synthase family protein [Tepidisphaeraceae bacterium]|jgi:N-acetylneuraminate synthase/N,N'-diacetyllegionaminate synthase
MEIHIAQRTVGPDQPVLVIAEIGVNHDGSLDRALALVEHARAAGADAVKLQIYTATSLMHPSGGLAEYQKTPSTDDSPIAMLQRYEIDSEQRRTIVAAIRAKGLSPIATPFSPGDVPELERLGLPAVKIASPDLVNPVLLKRVAALGKPMLLSVGTATMEEIRRTAEWLHAWNATYALLHCISCYPTPTDQAHLGWISELARSFPVPVGYSDHTTDEWAGGLAVAAGACLIEKHLTWDRTAPGPDHSASADPQQFARYVANVRRAESLRGAGSKRVLEIEEDVRLVSRQSLVLVRDLPQGHLLQEADLTVQRPGTGIPAAEIDKVIGRKLSQPLTAGAMLQWTLCT